MAVLHTRSARRSLLVLLTGLWLWAGLAPCLAAADAPCTAPVGCSDDDCRKSPAAAEACVTAASPACRATDAVAPSADTGTSPDLHYPPIRLYRLPATPPGVALYPPVVRADRLPIPPHLNNRVLLI